MKVSLQAVTPNAEEAIVEIARVSSKREDKQAEPEKLINYLIQNRHWSPFEHGFMTLKITTSKAIGIQLLRHRSFTFQEFSQRYAKVTDLEPASFRIQAAKNRQSSEAEAFSVIWNEDGTSESFVRGGGHMNEEGALEKYTDLSVRVGEYLNNGKKLYNELLDAGIAKECARMILPMTTETTIYMSGPVRSWIHLIQLRDDGHAQMEAQEIARECKRIFREEFPLISAALEWKEPEV